MPTFVEEVQAVAADDAPEFRRRVSARIEAVDDAVGVLEAWTGASRETRTELASKYETAKSLARDEIREARAVGDDADCASDSESDDQPAAQSPEATSPEDLLAHPDVSEDTKQRLREYSTKLHAFLDEEQSYEEAREQLRVALEAELALYQRLLSDVEVGTASVRDAQAALARFARSETPGPPNVTATDVLLDAGTGDE
ncbi:hypothetical protein [Halorussus litoreus]|uniref:hypothetical protein n=1 Tax=Halorussus litoreus TaxID=1710536 RepID=UPI0013007DBC|nr:hypothetical protein [Halorussus litoreus]